MIFLEVVAAGGVMAVVRYLAFRIVNALIILFLVLLITAVMMNEYVEDQIRTDIRERAYQEIYRNPQYAQWTEEQKQRAVQERIKFYEQQYGLDQPYHIRVLYRTVDAMMFNFGNAMVLKSAGGSPVVSDIILEALPRTILLFTTGTIVTIVIGILLGIKAATKVGSLLDRTISTFAMFTYSLPMWWVGMIFIFYFSYTLGIFPSGGMVSIPPPEEPMAYALDVLYHLALPLIVFVFVNFGGWSYATRSIVLNVLTEDFVNTARAKGVPERKILYGHVLRTASPPIVTSTTLAILGSIGGAIITEAVFNWPGIGRLFYQAILNGDMPVVIGLTYISTFLYVFAILALDFAYALLDPRIKVGVGGGR